MSRFALPMACLTLLGLTSFSAWALNFPNPPQPGDQALVKRFQADYARIKADPNYFKPPAAPMAMPCDVPQRDLYPAVGLFMAIPEEAEKIRLMSRKQMRDLGMDPDTAAKPMQYNNIRITPLKVACKNGKLDGETEFLVQYDSLMESVNSMELGAKTVKMTMRMMSQDASRYFLVFKDGKHQDTERYHVTQSLLRNESLYDDAQTAATMSKSKIPDSPAPQVAVFYMNIPAQQITSFTVSMAPKISGGLAGVNTSFQEQLDSNFMSGVAGPVSKTLIYKDDKFSTSSETPMKNGKYHGEQIQVVENYLKASGMRLDQMPGMERTRLVMVNGVEMLETRNCFIEGVMTKVQTCPKD